MGKILPDRRFGILFGPEELYNRTTTPKGLTAQSHSVLRGETSHIFGGLLAR
jgi:hypothetical protein